MIDIQFQISNDELPGFAGLILGYNIGKELSKREDVTDLDNVMERLQPVIIKHAAKAAGMTDQKFYDQARRMILESPAFKIHKGDTSLN